MLSTSETLAVNTLGFFLSGWASGQWLSLVHPPSNIRLFTRAVHDNGVECWAAPSCYFWDQLPDFPDSEAIRKTSTMAGSCCPPALQPGCQTQGSSSVALDPPVLICECLHWLVLLCRPLSRLVPGAVLLLSLFALTC